MSEGMPRNIDQSESHEILKEQPVIVVDIDGVIFDTPQQAVDRWNEIRGTNYATPDIYDHNATHSKQKFRHYHSGGKYEDAAGKFDDGFYDAQREVDGYRLVPGAREMLWRLKKEYGARIKALTARNPQNLRDVTEQGLSEHVGLGEEEEHLIDELHFSGDPDLGAYQEKGEILVELGAHVMVEDSVKNAQSSEKFKVPAFLLAQPYNETGHSWPTEKRATNWDELYERIVETLEAQGFNKFSEEDFASQNY
jgi:phosphoglycolate phosphatase-like HAD superfamily hydrolase